MHTTSVLGIAKVFTTALLSLQAKSVLTPGQPVAAKRFSRDVRIRQVGLVLVGSRLSRFPFSNQRLELLPAQRLVAIRPATLEQDQNSLTWRRRRRIQTT